MLAFSRALTSKRQEGFHASGGLKCKIPVSELRDLLITAKSASGMGALVCAAALPLSSPLLWENETLQLTGERESSPF